MIIRFQARGDAFNIYIKHLTHRHNCLIYTDYYGFSTNRHAIFLVGRFAVNNNNTMTEERFILFFRLCMRIYYLCAFEQKVYIQ